jgi:hypothetical protein
MGSRETTTDMLNLIAYLHAWITIALRAVRFFKLYLYMIKFWIFFSVSSEVKVSAYRKAEFTILSYYMF